MGIPRPVWCGAEGASRSPPTPPPEGGDEPGRASDVQRSGAKHGSEVKLNGTQEARQGCLPYAVIQFSLAARSRSSSEPVLGADRQLPLPDHRADNHWV